MNNQFFDAEHDNLPVPDGQERLATQDERDDVNKKIKGSHSTPGKTTGKPRSRPGARIKDAEHGLERAIASSDRLDKEGL